MSARTLNVRCGTWEQVELFHTRKLRDGRFLSMKVPFEVAVDDAVTLGLELPNEVVIAIDGRVCKVARMEGEARTWLEVELTGFTAEVVARIKLMAIGGAAAIVPSPRPPAPAAAPPAPRAPAPADEASTDERGLFNQLTAELKRLRQAPVHDVLGVAADADAAALRAGWLRLVHQHHPDLVVRRKAPAITHLAEELTILVNRAYDRLRAALVADGRASIVGSAVTAPPGWLIGFDDISSGEHAGVGGASGGGARRDPAATARTKSVAPDRRAAKVATIPPPSIGGPTTPQGGETFELRAREMLVKGDAGYAQEVLAAALVVYPRSRPLRSLYYVASALSALGKGEKMLATSQLETALAHYEQCSEAARLLDHLRRHDSVDVELLQRVFG